MTSTEKIIEQLAARARPVRPLAPAWVRATRWLLAAVVVIALATSLFGVRPRLRGRREDKRQEEKGNHRRGGGGLRRPRGRDLRARQQRPSVLGLVPRYAARQRDRQGAVEHARDLARRGAEERAEHLLDHAAVVVPDEAGGPGGLVGEDDGGELIHGAQPGVEILRRHPTDPTSGRRNVSSWGFKKIILVPEAPGLTG